jgi:hypothetical protein
MADALRKITSIFYDQDEIYADAYVTKCGYGEDLQSAMDKILRSGWRINKDVNNKFVLLTWVLRLYKNVKIRRIAALRDISKAKHLTPSSLEIKEMDKVADSLRKIDDSSLIEFATIIKESNPVDAKMREFKVNGLKKYEQDYYEYNMIRRNVNDQDEALWLMREVNTRISIIENYLETEKMSDSESKRWNNLYEKYLKLRDDLSSKIVYKDRFVGLQVNYPAIKGLDY